MTVSWNLLYTAVVLTCGGAFGLAWIVGAIYNIRHAPPAQRRRGWFGSWLVSIMLIVAARMLVPRQIWSALTFDSTALRAIGCVVLVASTLFTLWARLTLGTMWTAVAVIKTDHQLRTTGPYAITRHPIYTGILSMLTGMMLMSGLGIWIWFFVVGVIVLMLKAHQEEQLLEEAFGERYREYRQRVPQLVPLFSLRRARATTP